MLLIKIYSYFIKVKINSKKRNLEKNGELQVDARPIRFARSFFY